MRVSKVVSSCIWTPAYSVSARTVSTCSEGFDISSHHFSAWNWIRRHKHWSSERGR